MIFFNSTPTPSDRNGGSPRGTPRSFARLAGARGRNANALPNLAWSTVVPALDPEADVTAVAAHLRAAGVEAVVLDPLYLALAGDPGQVTNLLAVGPLVHGFAADCRDAGATPSSPAIRSRSRRGGQVRRLADLTRAGVRAGARSRLLVRRPPSPCRR